MKKSKQSNRLVLGGLALSRREARKYLFGLRCWDSSGIYTPRTGNLFVTIAMAVSWLREII